MTEAIADFREDRVGSALAGTNPTVLLRMRAGFAVIGDVQHFPGYCVLITDSPGVDQLIDLPVPQQHMFLQDMAALGRAVARTCRERDPQFRRINLEIQGNADAFLHAHVTPRYEWEPDELVRWPAGVQHWESRVDSERSALGPAHDELRAALKQALEEELRASEEAAQG
jgi:diadenosine tetraphosphate (Ap4A) HIT family hydrolase